MRITVRAMILFVMAVILSSCASLGIGGSKSADDWKYEREGVRLTFRSDPELNIYHETSHALLVCVYQLRDPNAFNQALDERDGLQKLLDCGRFDSSVTAAKKVIIQPGRDKTEIFDRYEGTKYVGIIGGYYALGRDTVARFYQVPMGGFFSKKPKALNLTVYLGPQELHGVVE